MNDLLTETIKDDIDRIIEKYNEAGFKLAEWGYRIDNNLYDGEKEQCECISCFSASAGAQAVLLQLMDIYANKYNIVFNYNWFPDPEYGDVAIAEVNFEGENNVKQ